MSTTAQAQRASAYAVSDAVLVLGLGIVGGIINTTISSIPHPHFILWGAQVPYGSFFVLTPIIAMLLIRKPGVAFATALIYGIIQAIAKANPSNIVFGITEGLGAEFVFALFRYRNFGALVAFLAGGIGAKTIENGMTLVQGNGGAQMMNMMSGMQAQQFAPWQTFLGGEVLALVVFGVLSGLVGWALARLFEQTRFPAWLNNHLGQTAR